jgi:microcystin-dependent protein
MSEPFIGEIRAFGQAWAPQGWALCNGQLLSINQNQALFSLLGTTYGGNGQTTFALPDLRGRVPMHVGNGVTLGQSAGEENHTLTQNEMPQHTHLVSGSTAEANQKNVAGNIWAASSSNPFAQAAPDATMNAASLGTAGGSQPHPNMQPYLTMNYCIAIQGIYPSRN